MKYPEVKAQLEERPLTKEEWYDDWQFYQDKRKAEESWRFKLGFNLIMFSKKLHRMGWKLVVRAEDKVRRLNK